MRYNNQNVRRQDRLLEEERAVEILKTAEYGVLSMIDEAGFPYGIPLNYVWDGDSSVYIHCAPEGRKLQSLQKNPQVSFCIIGRVNLCPSKFTTEYESVVLKGVAVLGLEVEERMKALELLLRKLSPDDMAVGMKYAEKSFHRTAIIRLDFSEFSGKRKYIK
ncbi:MAG: pyridoxamine 5'-phosphate oxidase family protein [Prevotella sp.]|nr:pyridoxamine 5'-phosphate oxidase family protein [Prevotella sp.]